MAYIHNSSNLLKTDYDLAILAGQVRADIKDEGLLLRNLVIFTDEDVWQKELTALHLENDTVKQNISLLESKVNTTEQKELIATLKNTNNEFNVYQDQIIALIAENKKEEAIDLIDKSSDSIHGDFFEVLHSLVATFDSNWASSLQTMLKDFQNGIIIIGSIFAIGIILIMSILIKSIWTLSTRLNSVSALMSNIANGKTDLDTKVEVISNDEIDQVAKSFNQMAESLAEQREKEKELTWTKTNIAEITTNLSGTHDLETLGHTFLSKVVPLMTSTHAVFYVIDPDEHNNEPIYRLISSYAFKERKHVRNTIRLGEGLIGQAILEKSPIIVTDVPTDYIQVTSGLGESTPLNLYVLPISFEGDVKAVLEIASFKLYSEAQQGFLEELIHHVGIIIESVMSRIRLAKLYEESQMLMEEIQAQSEELQNQQEELKATNEELEEQTLALRQSEEKLQMQQEELEQTNIDLEDKAKILEEQNKKFEIANKEVEKARAELEVKAEQLQLSSKYKSEFLANMSHELRTPLNSLLILSKLLFDNKEGNLTPKQMEYSKTIYSSGNDLLLLINDILDLAKIESGKMTVNPSNIQFTDLVDFVEHSFRPIANQKNLTFTILLKEGLPPFIYSDEVRIQQVLKNLLFNAFKFTGQGEVILEISVHSKSSKQPIIAFSVMDTGIGISKEKQEFIFEAFHQADGTTSRKYGGTGLGLSISREIATLLGGKIVVESTEGKGSTFTLYISDYENENDNLVVAEDEAAVSIENKAQTMESSENLYVESEPHATECSHIKRLLIVDDDKRQRNSLMELIGDMDFIIKAVSTGREAIEELKVNHFDCMILDLGLSDSSGYDLLEKVKESNGNNEVKVFVYTGRDLSSKEEIQLSKYVHTIIIKNEHSPQRLKAELELYLNESNNQLNMSDLPNNEEISITAGLSGKKVLLVDDDVRNVFALSTILEINGMEVIFAENGLESLKLIQKNPDIDVVLMDIMMPEMDGYEAIEKIREIPTFEYLPIIAVTAKAMKEDRVKCMEVGASDYIVKPIDPDQLISLIKVWLYQ